MPYATAHLCDTAASPTSRGCPYCKMTYIIITYRINWSEAPQMSRKTVCAHLENEQAMKEAGHGYETPAGKRAGPSSCDVEVYRRSTMIS